MNMLTIRFARPVVASAVVAAALIAVAPSAHADRAAGPPCTVSAGDDYYFTMQDEQLDVAASGYLINDELCGNGVTFGAASSGTFILGGAGAFSFVPAAGFTGDVTIPYAVDESDVEATIHIYVSPLPCTVDLADDEYETALDTPLSVAAPGVAANDAELCDNPLELVSPTTNGTLTFNADGSFDYTPNAGFVGADSFTYRVDEPPVPTFRSGLRAPQGAAPEIATVTITITAPTTTTTSTTVDIPTTTIAGSTTTIAAPTTTVATAPTLPATR